MASAERLSMYTQISESGSSSLVNDYAHLVKRIAQHLLGRMPASVQLDDLIQAGVIGLLEAARSFDSAQGASFETFAGIRIRGAMIDELRRGDWAPRSVHRNSRRIGDAIKAVEDRTGRDAQDAAVAAELGVSLDEYYTMLQDCAGSKLFSFDELTEVDDRPGGTGVNPLDGIQRERMREQLVREIERLPERERMVLALYYDEELNLKEVGMVLNVSESRVSQLHSQAAMRLRSRLTGWLADPD